MNANTSYLKNNTSYQAGRRTARYNTATEILDAIAETTDKEELTALYAALQEVS